jgi:membrane glycosyltransferase
MAGTTLVEMVRRMEADPEIGILQVPPTPVERRSFFARLQQFAARVYGPVFLEGFALWSQCDGNYWGHNAILRLAPFAKHCDLPVLPGDGPLGGEILSHDFVEAALMRRAGYKVCLAHDLDGSYEQCPPTMQTFAQRDQRWCQGNLQHLRLLLADGFHPASRLHLGMGVLSYAMSPLWLAFLVLTIIAAPAQGVHRVHDGATSLGGLLLFVVCMTMLLLPKVWGLWAWRRCTTSAAERVTQPRLGTSVAIETIASMLIAPNMMLFHTWFVVSTLVGHKVTWNVQRRDECRVTFGEAFAVHGPSTILGLVASWFVARHSPSLFLWLLPVLAGLWVAVPLAMLLGSVHFGRYLARSGLLLIPEEVTPPEVLRRRGNALTEAKATATTPEPDGFLLTLTDPTHYALHIGILRATECGCELPANDWEDVKRIASQDSPAAISITMRTAVLSDARAVAALHRLARTQTARRPPTTIGTTL